MPLSAEDHAELFNAIYDGALGDETVPWSSRVSGI